MRDDRPTGDGGASAGREPLTGSLPRSNTRKKPRRRGRRGFFVVAAEKGKLTLHIVDVAAVSSPALPSSSSPRVSNMIRALSSPSALRRSPWPSRRLHAIASLCRPWPPPLRLSHPRVWRPPTVGAAPASRGSAPASVSALADAAAVRTPLCQRLPPNEQPPLSLATELSMQEEEPMTTVRSA